MLYSDVDIKQLLRDDSTLPKKEKEVLFDMENGLVIPDISVPDKGEALKAFRDSIKDCTRCRLAENRTKFVFGDGNPDADIFFIGEGPGYDEDRTGIPFVGRAGKLLDKIIAAMKLKRSDVYIGNIVKCHPPKNRDPRSDEEKACIGYLMRQIGIIQPKIIVALGRVAANALLGTSKSMRELRGRLYYIGRYPMIATYHPAALLRNPNLKKPTWDDMKIVMKRVGIEI